MLSRLTSVSLSSSVYVSVTRRYCAKTAALIELLFAYKFDSTCSTLCFSEITEPLREIREGLLPQELYAKLWSVKMATRINKRQLSALC